MTDVVTNLATPGAKRPRRHRGLWSKSLPARPGAPALRDAQCEYRYVATYRARLSVSDIPVAGHPPSEARKSAAKNDPAYQIISGELTATPSDVHTGVSYP